MGISLVVQWLRLSDSSAGDLGSIPGQGTRSCMLQLRPSTAKLKHKKQQKMYWLTFLETPNSRWQQGCASLKPGGKNPPLPPGAFGDGRCLGSSPFHSGRKMPTAQNFLRRGEKKEKILLSLINQERIIKHSKV